MGRAERRLRRSASRGETAGFSLVEVSIAIGIVSFALMALLGILPIGIMSVQESMRQTACSHILQQISGDLEMMPFSQLPDYLAGNQYYDYDGKRLEGSSDAIFVARLTNAVPIYPGSTNFGALGDRLQRVTVNIRRAAEPENTAFRATLSVFNSSGTP